MPEGAFYGQEARRDCQFLYQRIGTRDGTRTRKLWLLELVSLPFLYSSKKVWVGIELTFSCLQDKRSSHLELPNRVVGSQRFEL
jgi:hypothetical protein